MYIVHIESKLQYADGLAKDFCRELCRKSGILSMNLNRRQGRDSGR